MPSQPAAYSEIFAVSTGAIGEDLIHFWRIMRTEILHSTLNWQSCLHLENGVSQALLIIEQNREFYTLDNLMSLSIS
jgi:hypothetical protein